MAEGWTKRKGGCDLERVSVYIHVWVCILAGIFHGITVYTTPNSMCYWVNFLHTE